MLEIKIKSEKIVLSCDGSNFEVDNNHPEDTAIALSQALMLINHGVEAVVITDDAGLFAMINSVEIWIAKEIRLMWQQNPVMICEAVHNSGLRSEGDPSPRDLILNDDFCVRLALAWEPDELSEMVMALKYKRRFGLSAEFNREINLGE